VNGGVVGRYLDAMVARDWEGLAACLVPDVERLGPYGDDYHHVDEYVPFLRRTLEALDGYVMRVDRVSEVDECRARRTERDGDDRRIASRDT